MTEFLRPRLNGERFHRGTIPLEMLGDLSVLGEMIIEVAKWRFLEAHPERERSPRGFSDGVSLGLRDIEDGSAIPVITLDSDPPQLDGMPSEYQEYFEEARDVIIKAIDAADREESPAGFLPARYLGYFDRLGRRLREGESIEFAGSSAGRGARITRESRRRLVLSSQMTTISQEVNIRCYIPEVDQDRKSFELRLPGGRKLRGSLDEPYRDSIIEVFNRYQDHGKALIQGIGEYDKQDRLLNLVSIDNITVLDPLDVPWRLAELRDLNEGWLDGEGNAPSHAFLDWLEGQFERLYPDDLPLPYIYPELSGGVHIEWSIGNIEVGLAISSSDRTGKWHSLDFQTKAGDERSLNLDQADSWDWITGEIRKMVHLIE